MKNEYSILIDWDDVLCQCNEYLLKLINEKHGTNYKLKHLTNWGGTGDPILDHRFKYMEDPMFHKNAPMYPGAKSFIYELINLGCDVFIMTAVPASQTAMRMERIMKEFPEFDPGNVIFGSRKDLVKADFMLDDACHNILGSTATYPVLFRRPWNAHCTGLMAVNDYQGFLTLVRSVMYPSEKIKHDGPLVLVGPSGSGKTTRASELNKTDGFKRVISYTTRRKRSEEPEDAYIFVDNDTFDEAEHDGSFIELSSYGNNRYGSRKQDIESVMDEKNIPVMVLDICGAVSVKQHYPNATLVFIERDKESCFRSLLERHLPIDETVNRLASFEAEMRNKRFCDITVKNNRPIEYTIDKIKDFTL